MIGTIIFMLVVWVVISFLATVNLFIGSRRMARIEGDLVQRGMRGTGHITGDVSSITSTTLLPYSYEYEGKKYTRRQMVSKQYQNTLYRGASVDIIYLPDDPKVALIECIKPAHRQSRMYRRNAYRGVIYLCVALPLLVVLLMNFH